ncbi:MAG: biopolymer transporter ExbD [Deltaproteobacteria bacterium]|nr:biopolymer transporter ExbD [Deltaproteobacteria bacterium]
MAGGTRKRGMITDINVTPLVDIMLVLLIIFMLTANLIAKQAIEVDLPKAAKAGAVQPKTLAVTLTRDGAIYLNGKDTDPVALRQAIRAAVAEDAKALVLISGDKNVSHGRVVWLLDTVRALGVTSFAIQIDPTAAIAPNLAKPAGAP